MNPFLGKTLTQLRDGVPGCSNPELDALAACVCRDGWVQYFERHPKTNHKKPGWYQYKGWNFWLLLSANNLSRFAPTTDWREAGRLLKKYRLDVKWFHKEYGEIHFLSQDILYVSFNVTDKSRFGVWHRFDPKTLNRALTEAACIVALTKWIERGGDD